jgi:hypothetical protein
LQEALQLDENQYKNIDPSMEYLRVDMKKLTCQLNQNKGKEKREDLWCTFCRIEGHHKNECPTIAQYLGVGIPNPLSLGGPWCEI